MRHIDFGVPDRFKRQRHLNQASSSFSRQGFGDDDKGLLQRGPDFGRAYGSIQVKLRLPQRVTTQPTLVPRMGRASNESPMLM